MARLRDAPIGAAEMLRFLEVDSDFGFELRVLRLLNERGIECQHVGHYSDPITKKSREFDIRLRVSSANCHLFAAIECKNLRDNFPLIVSCVPRAPIEAWHEIVDAFDVRQDASPLGGRSRSIRIDGPASHYAQGDWVGKSTAQVGVDTQGEIISHDKEVYDKWGQSLASLGDLASDIDEIPDGNYATALPIVVVPDGRLWQASYQTDGRRIRDPERVDRCSVYIGGAEVSVSFECKLAVSHVEFMTVRGLMLFVTNFLEGPDAVRRLISKR